MDSTIEAGGFKVEFVGPPVAKVDLILQPSDAVAGLATVVRGYKQVYSPVPPAGEEWAGLLGDLNRTKLHTPLEMLSFTWLVRDVTRAWTHQAVRTRVGAAYVQESMRFSDKRQAKVLVPPAIAADAGRLGAYRETVAEAFQTYAQMVEDGVPIQDARGVLPHNVLTHIFISYTLSTLAKTASLRYCCQAQNMKADGEGEWKTVLEQMRSSLPLDLQPFVCAPWDAGEVSCGFAASFDRPCAWPEKFQPNLDRLLASRGKDLRTGPMSYGLTAEQLVERLGLTPEERERANAALASQYPALGQWKDDMAAQLGQAGHQDPDPAQPTGQTLFGMPVRVDPRLPVGGLYLDLSTPGGHGGPAGRVLYQKDDFKVGVRGQFMDVQLRTSHLWKAGKNGLAIKLFDRLVTEAAEAGAKTIQVFDLDDQQYFLADLAEFNAKAIKMAGGDDYGPSRYMLLKDWKRVPTSDTPGGEK